MANNLYIPLKYFVVICFTISFGHSIIAQDEFSKMADSVYQIGHAAYDENDYDKAIEYYQKARRFYKNKNDHKGLAITFNGLGLTYQQIEENKLAHQYFRYALDQLKKHPDEELLSFVYNNLGMLSSDENKLDSATYYFEKSLGLKRKLKDSSRMTTTLNNLGIVMLKQKEFDKALQYNRQSLRIKQEVADTSGMIGAYSNFANIHGFLGQFDSVKHYLDQQVPLLETHGNSKDLLMFYGNTGEYYKAIGDYKTALDYKDSVLFVQKKLFNEQISANLAEYEVKYKSQEQENALKEERYQNALLTKRELKERNKKTLYLVLSISLVIVTGLLVFIFRSKLRQNRKEKSLLEKEISLKEKELLTSSNTILQKKEIMMSLKDKIEELKEEYQVSEALIKVLEDSLRQDNSADQEWQKFRIHFEQTHDSFFSNLKNQFPKLTEGDLRHCAYIKIGLTTKEISSLLNIAPSSVQKSRVRLKKKLDLDKEVDLQNWIKSL